MPLQFCALPHNPRFSRPLHEIPKHCKIIIVTEQSQRYIIGELQAWTHLDQLEVHKGTGPLGSTRLPGDHPSCRGQSHHTMFCSLNKHDPLEELCVQCWSTQQSSRRAVNTAAPVPLSSRSTIATDHCRVLPGTITECPLHSLSSRRGAWFQRSNIC